MPNSSLATVEEDGCVILSRVLALSPVGTREVTVVPAAIKPNQTKPVTISALGSKWTSRKHKM